MNHILEKFAREWLKANLALCRDDQINLFIRMYCKKPLDHGKLYSNQFSFQKVVDSMPLKALDWAMTQVEKTLSNNKSRRG